MTIHMSLFLFVASCAIAASVPQGALSPYPTNIFEKCPVNNVSPRTKPTNVNNLMAQDIKVVMALGDSITAAFGAMGRNVGISKLLNEFRGLSFAGGADTNTTSLYTAFRHYYPKLVGGSTGNHLLVKTGMTYYPNDALNAAQSGAHSYELNIQIDRLKKVMKTNFSSLMSEWKFASLFIGANDVCSNCEVPLQQQVDMFGANVKAALIALQSEFQPLFVAVTPIFNISGVYDRAQKKLYCTGIHAIPWACKCVFTNNTVSRARADIAATMMRARLAAIVKSFAGISSTFGVTMLPFTSNVNPAYLPDEFFSNLDCFHPSAYGQQQLAINAWNQLFLPSTQRASTLKPGVIPYCPTADDRLQL